MTNVLLAFIAGMLVLLYVKTEKTTPTQSFGDFLLLVAINFLIPIVVAAVLAVLFLWVAAYTSNWFWLP